MPESIGLLKTSIEFGITGLVIFIIIRPIIYWFMKRIDDKDKYIETLVNNHFSKDQERHESLIKIFSVLPSNIESAIKKAFKKEKRFKNK